ncbi:Por secretion system C-terminal sorting domain-containing protein [Nonlabens sp. Hel1_33_55]|uniref:T9SS type A sorting domain-containing protein n=1 Tax=Nonlabens sp. Hel1_33_55 TaxID=1336802 RepID=UPI000875B2BC|nr:T9SS type A sorting domain-containing protein [Nonlabens sp. Hel1_33_55]SCX97425.1 Por secretion system C-terminal sorting domain-containing protein [Nonlabens sp. Hel1_33_55]
MTHFYSLIIFFSFYTGSSQSLPVNFEGDITTSNFVDFEGGTAIVTSNPNSSGINTSSSVARIIRDGGAPFAGSKILLTDNLDFSELTKITMKVYSSAPVGTTVKFKLEGSGPAADVDAFTTVSNSWETLEWVFVGTENNLNEIVFMFDFGNVGDGSDDSTFYFDDIEQVSGPVAPVPTSLPIDFESDVVSTDFINYNGAKATIISNPQMDEDNPSETVCQVVRDGGNFWAGSKVFLNENIDLSTMWYISMKVYTTAPVGTRIKLELENSGGITNLDQLTTVSGAWETISWNFDGKASDYNRIQVMFDFGTIGDGSSTSTFLFDEVQQISGPALPEALPTTLPIDFENSVVTTDFTNFFGAETTILPNPKMDANNPSATVGKFLRSGGAGFMRSKLRLTDYLKNMSTTGTISMKVYTEAPVGSILKFKLESTPPEQFGKEQDALTTVSGEWATYTWDLSNADSPIYDVLTLMLGYNGANDASPNATFFFDDIQIISNTLSNDVDQALSIDDIYAFPNPSKDLITITSKNESIENITLYNTLGNKVNEVKPNSLSTIIDTSTLASGMYFARISTTLGVSTITLVKK